MLPLAAFLFGFYLGQRIGFAAAMDDDESVDPFIEDQRLAAEWQ